MKKLNFGQMEDIQGGVSCFFAFPLLLHGIHFNPLIAYSGKLIYDCWNS